MKYHLRPAKLTALILSILMLSMCFMGVAGAHQSENAFDPSVKELSGPKPTTLPETQADATDINNEEDVKNVEETKTYREETDGVMLYAYRSWSETEQRDFVSFMSNDLSNITSLWSFPGGMLSAEYVDGTLYVVDDNLHFCAVNAQTGESTQITTLSYVIYDLAYDYTSHTMFCIAFSYSQPSRLLARIDLATGEMSIMGTFSESTGGVEITTLSASSEYGVLYGVGEDGNIYTIDYQANCELLAATGFTTLYSSSMTYCYENDSIYWQHNPGQDIVKINPETGECTVIGNMSHYTTLTGITTIPNTENIPPYNDNLNVTDIELTSDVLLLSVGLSKQMSFEIKPFNAPNKNVTWSSSNTSVVSVDSNGVVTGVGPGNATITVVTDDGGFSDTCEIEVVETPVDFVGFRLYNAQGAYGDYISFSDVSPENVTIKWRPMFEMYSSEYCNGTLYTSDWYNGQFASVNLETGEYTPIGKCQYTFTALTYDYESQTMFGLAYDGNGTAIYMIDLETAALTRLCHIKTNRQIIALAVARDGNFYAINDRAELLIVDDYGYVEVVSQMPIINVFGMQSISYDYRNDCLYWACYASGELLRVDLQTAEFISLGKISEGAEITAMTILNDEDFAPDPVDLFPVTGVRLAEDELTIAPRISDSLNVQVYPWNASDKSITWQSSDESIATVDQSGKVTGVGAGVVAITATTNDGGFTSTCEVTVLESGIEVRGSRVYSQSTIGDYAKMYDYSLPHVESMWVPKSTVYAADYYDGTLYGYAQNTGLLFALDPETGDSTIIGPCYYQIYEMAFDYSTRTMYCMVIEKNQKCMARIDLNTAEITVTGSFDSAELMLTLSGGRDGMFYGIDLAGDFYRIDNEGHCTLVGNTGFQAAFLQSMTYDYATDTIYWAQYPDSQLVRIDPETGVGTSLGIIEGSAEIGGLYTICDEQYYPDFIPGVAVTGVSINLDEFKLSPEGTRSLAVCIEPYNAENREVVWTSSNERVAVVDENGNVTALAVGRATITATTVDGGFTTSSLINVVENGTAYYAYRNNGIEKSNDWVTFSDTATTEITSLWDAQGEIYAAEYLDGYLYFSYRFGGSLIKADIETGEYEVIGSSSYGCQVWGMTYDYVTETMYALVYNESTYLMEIAKFDLTTGDLTPLFSFSSQESAPKMIAAARDGLYVMNAEGELSRYNEMGVGELVVATEIPIPFIQSLRYDYSTDKFIWTQNCWGFNEDAYFVTLDPVTGERTVIGVIGEGGLQPLLTGLVCIPNPVDLPNFTGIVGDANGDGVVNTGDVASILRWLVGLDDSIETELSDINRDGYVNSGDAAALLEQLLEG